ncbi:DUF2116 family Zn-ribbon domain-containing protein [Aeromonas veronii]
MKPPTIAQPPTFRFTKCDSTFSRNRRRCEHSQQMFIVNLILFSTILGHPQ